MQKIYILRENEEDGVLLDTLLAQGIEPDEYEFCNPLCPLCSSSTLLAFTEGDDYQVLNWTDLDEKDVAGADAWYLICSHFECEWEEQVERVTHPLGATLFDLNDSYHCFDDECGLGNGPPFRQRELIEHIKRLQRFRTARKLQAFADEAAWHYKHKMAAIRKWLQRVPPGRSVQVTVIDDEVGGTFLTALPDGCMLMKENGEVITIEAESIYSYYPRRFDQWGPDEHEVEPDIKSVLAKACEEPDGWITLGGMRQCVVVRGYELEFEHVDRFGRYNVHTRNQQAAEALGLTQKHEGYWEGYFRRSDVDMRYDVKRMVKVKGYWVGVSGYTNTNHLPAVSTEDPDAARALGLELRKPIIFEEEGEPSLHQRTPRWHGTVQRHDVEEEAEAKSWYWPLPEIHVAEGDGKR